ncbi:MAG: Ig-like domain-containing domain [Eubacteriales bacterium]
MTDAELLIECKKGLNIQVTSTAFDSVLTQKLLAVKSYMKSAGVSDEALLDDLAVGVIALGVTDLWNAGGGEIKFSPAFHTLLGQLAIGSSVLTVSSSPVAGAVAVTVDVQPVLTFNKRIVSYEVSLVSYDTLIPVTITASLDITGKILILKPSSDLAPATKYAIVIDAVTAYSGQTLGYTVISFTTN